MNRVVCFSGITVATVFGTGYFPLAPGTVGSLVSAAFYLLTATLSGWRPLPFILLAPIGLLGYWGCSIGHRLWGGDPSRVTADEFVGCWIACLAVPLNWGIPGIAAAFILFRVLDITKPWPVCRLDRMSGPAGILLDDVAAGIMAGVLLLAGRLLHVPA